MYTPYEVRRGTSPSRKGKLTSNPKKVPRYRKNLLHLIEVLQGVSGPPFGQSKYCQYLINHQGI